MAYTPTQWKDGDLITAEKLNKLEQGVENEQIGPQGPQGQKGDAGTNGTSAGFGTPTATVDGGIGTPSVTVDASGPDTAKVFSFSFKNLKGEKGDTGSAGAQGPAGNGVKSIALVTTAGVVTGGTVTFTDDSTAAITITTSEA